VLGGSFRLSDKVRVDLGARYENEAYVQTSQNTTTTPVLGDTVNSLTLYDQDVWGQNASYRHFSRNIDDWAGSIGLNYALNSNTSFYALGARAYKMPALDEFLNASAAQQVALLGSKRNWTGELGVKHASRTFGVTLDGFYTILKDSGMTQVEIAKILGARQPQVSLLMRNRAGNFSVGRLMEFLTALRQDVEITVRPTNKEHGALSVVST